METEQRKEEKKAGTPDKGASQLLVEQFMSFENRHELFRQEEDGVCYWPLVRLSVYTLFLEKKIFTEPCHPDFVRSKGKMIRKVFTVAMNAILGHPIFHRTHADVIFHLAPRKVRTGQGYLSVILDSFLDGLPQTYRILEKPVRMEHLKYDVARDIAYTDWYEIKRILYSRLGIGKKSAQKAFRKFREILPELEKETSCEIDVRDAEKIFTFAYATHRACYEPFRRILKRAGTKVLVTVVHYEQENLVMNEAAHSLGLPILELQHGILNDSHIGYNLRNGNARYLPDKILTWGEMWTRGWRIFGETGRVVPCGYPYLESRGKIRKAVNPRTILFISQGPVEKELAEVAVQLHRKVASLGYHIVFKLHPNECVGWRKRCPSLAEEKGIEVIENSQIGIYECFDRAEVQVGVSSTAIFEGLCWNLRTYIVHEKTCEYMRFLYENSYAALVSGAEEIADGLLAGGETTPPPAHLIWCENAKENIIREITKACVK